MAKETLQPREQEKHKKETQSNFALIGARIALTGFQEFALLPISNEDLS